MTLEQYLKTTGIQKQAFAETVGVSKGMITHILRGRKYPSVLLALKIQKATEGKVTVHDLLPEGHPARQLLEETHGENADLLRQPVNDDKNNSALEIYKETG
ncbi:MAG: helix-turn-helix domain-containing protein [Myxococcales bacterium]|nr:helix-turn-helix domain-containing protein [Myxococcales bacterium]